MHKPESIVDNVTHEVLFDKKGFKSFHLVDFALPAYKMEIERKRKYLCR